MVINKNYIGRIDKIPGSHSAPVRKKTSDTGMEFEKILKETIDRDQSIKFSKHAQLRLQSRNITLSQAQTGKLNEAVKKADEKGIKDSLIIVDGVALVVNVRSRTVITAASSGELKENVFTNIDGAVFT